MRYRTSLTLSVLLASFSAAGAGHSPKQATPTLVDVVRTATASFRDPDAAMAAGWMPMPACVSGPEEGAMGVHFVNGPLIGDGQLDPERPEALIYEPKSHRMQLLGAEFIALADAWHATHEAPPVLLGQQFHYVGSPNRYGLPPFYELHVWAWKPNPHGTFADWNPAVSCDGFATGG